jgi:hypothetical protein
VDDDVVSLYQTVSDAYRVWRDETPFAPDEVNTALEQRGFEALGNSFNQPLLAGD